MKTNLQKLFAGTTYEQMVEAYLVEVRCCLDDCIDARDHTQILRSLYSVGCVMFGDRWLQDRRVTARAQR